MLSQIPAYLIEVLPEGRRSPATSLLHSLIEEQLMYQNRPVSVRLLALPFVCFT